MFENEILKRIKVEGFEASDLVSMLEVPKDTEKGDIALPCFRFAKALRKSPVQIANDLKENFDDCRFLESVEAVGGYLNFKLNRVAVAKELETVLQQGENYGASKEGAGKTVCIDFSSVNIAKPFHIGHLSTTVIGGALYRIFEKLGYKVVGINHLGDWGTQFGKLIVAFHKWGNREEIEKGGVVALNKIYVKYHQEAEKDPSLDDEARAWFKRIEDGDKTALDLFYWFKEITLLEVGKIYDRLKIKFDSYDGESFYNDKMQPVLDILEQKGLLVEDNGAKIVKLDDYDMPPCLLVKADGATLYATRDLAAAYYRRATYDFTKCLYVVAYQQNLHFRQLFKVLELMDFSGYEDMEHINFGMVSLEDGSMSSREGRVVWLKDVLDQAVDKARLIISEKNPNAEDCEQIANSVGIGAVVFSALWNNRIKDIVFSFDKVLNFDGETAPYIQYTHARCCSLLRKGGEPDVLKVDYNAIANNEGYEVVKSILAFPNAIEQSAQMREPCVVSRHIVDLAEKFNRFYISNRIVDCEECERDARLLLAKVTAQTLKAGLSLLGIDAPVIM
ncbi:MAG: arginine--tRNA ligase [Clostridia bacterium]|nr:arginine--tRNA ligase [Clostridia bacterium]